MASLPPSAELCQVGRRVDQQWHLGEQQSALAQPASLLPSSRAPSLAQAFCRSSPSLPVLQRDLPLWELGGVFPAVLFHTPTPTDSISTLSLLPLFHAKARNSALTTSFISLLSQLCFVGRQFYPVFTSFPDILHQRTGLMIFFFKCVESQLLVSVQQLGYDSFRKGSLEHCISPSLWLSSLTVAKGYLCYLS